MIRAVRRRAARILRAKESQRSQVALKNLFRHARRLLVVADLSFAITQALEQEWPALDRFRQDGSLH
jgi:hypothetical protein